jgi:hypothetical protein
VSATDLRKNAAKLRTEEPELAKIRGSASGQPSLASSPRCGRCGTSVDAGQEWCEVCGPIMAARTGPVAMVQFPPAANSMTLENLAEEQAHIKSLKK